MTELERILFNALRDLVMVCGTTGDAFEDFEEQAARFRHETGFFRPGKDAPAVYCGPEDREVARTAYNAWVESKIEAARAVLNEIRGL